MSTTKVITTARVVYKSVRYKPGTEIEVDERHFDPARMERVEVVAAQAEAKRATIAKRSSFRASDSSPVDLGE